MHDIERRVGREAGAMTRRAVITKAIAKQLSWVQASEILGISARPMRRRRRKLHRSGMAALRMQDLGVALDDADGRMLYARFFPQEGTASTFAALESVVRNYGRFCELYTDRGSHFCQSGPAGEVADEQHGQVSQALRALGIRQILARSPRARGRSERAFGTIQGRLPQELRHHGITDYPAANRYLAEHFVADFNRRFTVKPAQPES